MYKNIAENLKVFTLKECLMCHHFKWELNRNNILFEETIINDGTKKNSDIGDSLEKYYKTDKYPIVKLYPILVYNPYVFISGTDLEPRNGIHIFQTLDEIIIKIKQLYEI